MARTYESDNAGGRKTRVTVPDGAHPVVRFIFRMMGRFGVTYPILADGSGLCRETITAWRVRNKPDLESAEAALGYLGYALCPVPVRNGEIVWEELEETLRAYGFKLKPAGASEGDAIPLPPQARGLDSAVRGFGYTITPEHEETR